MKRGLIDLLVAYAGIGLLILAGCSTKPRYPPVEQIAFKDDVETNAEAPADSGELEFRDSAGNAVRLADYRDKKNVVLIFTRGSSRDGYLCPFCTAQTSRLIANYPKFVQRDTEVLLVFPGARTQLTRFIDGARYETSPDGPAVPFPVLLDEELKAVEYFGIRHDLAHPSTYILDRQGQVRFAYVGASDADRPSLLALFQQLDRLKASAP